MSVTILDEAFLLQRHLLMVDFVDTPPPPCSFSFSSPAYVLTCPEKGGLEVPISTTQHPTDQRSDCRPTSCHP